MDRMKGNLDFFSNILNLQGYIYKDRMMDEFNLMNNIFCFQVYINIYCSLDELGFCCSILFILVVNCKYRKKDVYYF